MNHEVMQQHGFINKVFYIVAYSLLGISKRLGMTYNEINIIVYYLIIPLTWTILFDIGIKNPLTTITLLFIWIIIYSIKRKHFKEWCDTVFAKSVDFLNSFKYLGWNYYTSSVIICVMLPFVFYTFLVWWAFVK